MILPTVSRNGRLLASAALGVALAASPASAQTPPRPVPPSPAESPAAVPAPGVALGMLEGSVKAVDPGNSTLKVSSGPLGIMGRTVEVNSGTQINVEGRQGSLADLQEGTKIRASYETREGKDIATRIEVMPVR